MRTKVEGRKYINIIYIIAIFTFLFSNFFHNELSIVMLLKPNYEFKNNTEIHFINVGQGDAIAVKFDNGQTMLIDSGIELYRDKLSYYLDNIVLEDKKKIDYLVLTHIDIDHSSNIKYIMDKYEIGEFIRPSVLSKYEDENTNESTEVFDEIIETAISHNTPMRTNDSGIELHIGDTIVTWLAPINIESKNALSSNDSCPVIRIDYNNHSALLTGDISSDIENDLINYYNNEILDVDILKLAHHGSAGSTSSLFLEVTSPQYACVCVGENTYGHPSNETIERILNYDREHDASLASNLYTTKEDGNIIFILSGFIDVNTIRNIDDYSYVSYFIYSSIAVICLLVLMLKPYYFALKKDVRFVIQNKKFKKYLEKEKNIQSNKK